MNPLPLADIQPAAEPSAWPPAIGWWLSLAIGLLILGSLLLWLVRRYRLRRFSRKACQHLLRQGNQLDPQAINEVLKLTALHYCPESKLARLSGARWHQWLQQQTPAQQQPQVRRLCQLLAQSQYSQQPLTDAQHQELLAVAQCWLAQAWRLTGSKGGDS